MPPPAPDVDRLPLVLVPGIMASNLKYGSTSVWPMRSPLGLRALKRAQASDLRATQVLRHVRVLPLGPPNDLWGDFIDDVLQSTALGYVEGVSWFPFAYNWADDVRNSAVQLDRFLEDVAARLGDDTRPGGAAPGAVRPARAQPRGDGGPLVRRPSRWPSSRRPGWCSPGPWIGEPPRRS